MGALADAWTSSCIACACLHSTWAGVERHILFTFHCQYPSSTVHPGLSLLADKYEEPKKVVVIKKEEEEKKHRE